MKNSILELMVAKYGETVLSKLIVVLEYAKGKTALEVGYVTVNSSGHVGTLAANVVRRKLFLNDLVFKRLVHEEYYVNRNKFSATGESFPLFHKDAVTLFEKVKREH